MCENESKRRLPLRLALSSLCVFAILAAVNLGSAGAVQAFGYCNAGFWPCQPPTGGCIPTTAMCCGNGTYCGNGSVCYYPPSGTICCGGGYYGGMDGQCWPVGVSGDPAPTRGQQPGQRNTTPMSPIPPDKVEVPENQTPGD